MKQLLCDQCNERFDTLSEVQRHDCNNPISPKHYKNSNAICTYGKKVECIQIVRHFDSNIGNVIKYLWPYRHKGNGLEQLKKAHWYLRDEIRKSEPEFDANKD